MFYKTPLILIIFILFVILFFMNINTKTEQHFIVLARSLLKGETSIIPIDNNISNLVLFNSNYYWPLGPFPAIILMPFVYFINPFYQGYISFPFTVINFFLLYKIALKFKLSSHQSVLCAIFFIFGSIYTPLAMVSASWYFAQVIACSFMIFAIYEFLFKRRYFLIGIYLAAATATRLNIILSSVFFLYFLLKKPFKIKNLLFFSLPILLTLFSIGYYNHIRFGNPFENGYNLQLVNDETAERRHKGLFSPIHIPSNLFFMLLKGPEPVLDNTHELTPPFITFDAYGLSLFFLSPVLFLAYSANFKKRLIKISAITTVIMLIPIVTYYGIGQRQVGFRYALDVFPFLYLIILDPIRKTTLKILYPVIFFGVLFSVYFSFIYLAGKQIN